MDLSNTWNRYVRLMNHLIIWKVPGYEAILEQLQPLPTQIVQTLQDVSVSVSERSTLSALRLQVMVGAYVNELPVPNLILLSEGLFGAALRVTSGPDVQAMGSVVQSQRGWMFVEPLEGALRRLLLFAAADTETGAGALGSDWPKLVAAGLHALHAFASEMDWGGVFDATVCSHMTSWPSLHLPEGRRVGSVSQGGRGNHIVIETVEALLRRQPETLRTATALGQRLLWLLGRPSLSGGTAVHNDITALRPAPRRSEWGAVWMRVFGNRLGDGSSQNGETEASIATADTDGAGMLQVECSCCLSGHLKSSTTVQPSTPSCAVQTLLGDEQQVGTTLCGAGVGSTAVSHVRVHCATFSDWIELELSEGVECAVSSLRIIEYVVYVRRMIYSVYLPVQFQGNVQRLLAAFFRALTLGHHSSPALFGNTTSVSCMPRGAPPAFVWVDSVAAMGNPATQRCRDVLLELYSKMTRLAAAHASDECLGTLTAGSPSVAGVTVEESFEEQPIEPTLSWLVGSIAQQCHSVRTPLQSMQSEMACACNAATITAIMSVSCPRSIFPNNSKRCGGPMPILAHMHQITAILQCPVLREDPGLWQHILRALCSLLEQRDDAANASKDLLAGINKVSQSHAAF
jgi:hypothetical protein